jgi:hypothetical protein
MNYREELFTIIQSLTGQKNILTIPREFIDYTGDIKAALLLSQLVYWTDKAKDTEGWIFKTYKAWQEEIALTEYEIRAASAKLKKKGILATKIKKAHGNPTVHYRIDRVRFSESFLDFFKKRRLNKSRNDSGNNSESNNTDYTKTITETTTTTDSVLPSEFKKPDENNFQYLVSLIPEEYRHKKSVLNILKDHYCQHGYDYVRRNMIYTNTHHKKNYSAYLSKSLKNDYGIDIPGDEEADRKVQKKNRQRRKLSAEQHEQEKELRGKVNEYMNNLPQDMIKKLESDALGKLEASLQKKAKDGDIFAQKLLRIEMLSLIESQLQRGELLPC